MELVDRVISYVDADRVAVAYSGGMDSTALLYMLDERIDCTGIFVDSPLISERQRNAALNNAKHLDLDVIVKRIEWKDLGETSMNDEMRCYHCKRSIYQAIVDAADEIGALVCVDGENADDLNEDRPGREAAKELGILSPFSALDIGRDEIESFIRTLGLYEPIVKDTCMATRIPTGTPIDEELMRRTESIEEIVRNITGVKQLRVRIDGKDANIQTSPEEIPMLIENEDILRKEFDRIDMRMTVDPDGYGKKV